MSGSDKEQHSHDSESHQPVEEGAVAPKKEVKQPMSIGVLLFAIFSFAALVFNCAAIAIGMMDSRHDKSCISVWGYKPECLKTWFRTIDWNEFVPLGSGEFGYCKKGDSLMKGAQAFSVMCVIGAFLTVCVSILELMHFAELAVVSGIIASIATVATLVTWATMLAMYWSNLCGVGVYADEYKIGKGLILFITAWSVQMVALIVLIIDIYRGKAK